ncbi:MAG: uracil-DNA glycosylase [Dehalococcoidia bacterium]|jgi:DNA polymerase|nr:uracil-DNA glycosylase [Dehalococcoidia bacterium]
MAALDELSREIQDCHECELSQGRTQAVPGEGADNPAIFFLGEAPGWHEDQQGRPFVGSAGHFLDELIASIGYERGQVFITNVVKCRPPGNRDPLPVEVQTCRKWLDRQFEIMKPEIIVTLGRYAMVRYFPGETIGNIHGKPKKCDGILYFPMYHPAAALHQGSLRQTIKDDMLKIPELLAQEVKQDNGGQQRSGQLGMF